MNIQSNPFTPSFGKIPEILAGRDGIIQDMEYALASGGGDPNLCSLFSGPRGVGKTVLLSYLAKHAGQFGWIAVNVTARPGMLEDIIERTIEAADGFIEQGSTAHLSSIGISSLLSASWTHEEQAAGNWCTRMNRILDELGSQDIGLLITIDEIDPSLDELVDFAATFQHFVREDRKVALMMAGLPARVSALLSDKSVSFLRRASQHVVGRISDHDVRNALSETIRDAGKDITDEALNELVRATDGFAYMLQLTGFRTWMVARDAATIDAEQAKRGVELAVRDFLNGVVKKTLQELSDMDVQFLIAMLPDEGKPSLISDIAERMKKQASYARVYRARLIEQGVIAEAGRGKVVFDMPMLRAYLMERV